MSLIPLQERDRPFMQGEQLACPVWGSSTRFQLVDEFGSGQPYAGLTYQLIDYEDVIYTGKLDANGVGNVAGHYCGPLELRLNQPYQGHEKFYVGLKEREHYPLPITELQVRAEKTQFINKDNSRTLSNPAHVNADPCAFYQVEVRELVEHVGHLPPLVPRTFAPAHHLTTLFRPLPVKGRIGYEPELAKRFGIPLLPNKHHVLEVRPLRALLPLLSTQHDFCALNLYQLALMATLSYAPFGQDPDEHPVLSKTVTFPLQPSSGNWFGDALAKADEIWRVDAGQKNDLAHYPLYKDVPYSKRLEVLPFDPELYPENNPERGSAQENPARLHFFDDTQFDGANTDTQAFITHTDEVILLSIRGTASAWDLFRDIDANQAPLEPSEGVGQAHRGFYGAAQALREFVVIYLDKFYNGQTLIITGHSLGGAIALLLAEMLRRNKKYAADILLYTYGAPRAADQTFIDGAAGLTHHRMVNHNDPIPGVPGVHMDTKPEVFGAGIVVSFTNAPLGALTFFAGISNLRGAPYGHHGKLHHFMPVRFEDGRRSAILWAPGCESVTEQACNEILRQKHGLPTQRAFEPAFYLLDHLMVGAYVPNAWATLRRWQSSYEKQQTLVTEREFNGVDKALHSLEGQLKKVAREARPDAYRKAHEKAYDALRAEVGKVQTARERLLTLRSTTARETDVYGNASPTPQDLAHWKAHALNTTEEPLATAPPELVDNDQAIAAIIGGHVVGAPHDVDIDSIG